MSPEEVSEAFSFLRTVSKSGWTPHSTKHARVLLAWIAELQSAPRLPKSPDVDVLSAMFCAYNTPPDYRGWAAKWSAVYAALYSALAKPKTVPAWKVTALSPNGAPYEHIVLLSDYVRYPPAAKERAQVVASERLCDDYTNVSVTQVEVPA